ncbi:MarR family transcriptional regulator [Rhodococcus sp. NPDC047139]|uniref:MarR family winged helix-turn-helix transcriptional regulator n=1 Tax=Rhodococcus sp. NPDC047139 TaxID=3155141 RepID=UPI003408A269
MSDKAQAHELADAIFLLGRTLRGALVHHDTDVLPSALVAILLMLARMGECRPSELAVELCVSQSSLSRQIAELVERGLVDRHPDPDDRRAHRVSCSESGLEILDLVRKRRTERLSAELADWDETEIASAITTLERLTASLAPLVVDPRRSNS